MLSGHFAIPEGERLIQVRLYYSLIMTAALTAPRQWALLGDVVVVETRVWPNEALVTV